MRSIVPWVLAMTLAVFSVGCGNGEEAASESAPEASDTAAAPAEAAPPAVTLPDGYPENIPMYPELELTAAETLDAATAQFKITGTTLDSYERVLERYEVTFREAGWTEEMSMSMEGTSIITVSKDGLIVTVEAIEGGRGSILTYTTGRG